MEFTKVKDDGLYTAVVNYCRGPKNITLMPTIHFGQKTYYRLLQKEINKCDTGFYEKIKPLAKEAELPPRKKKYTDLRELIIKLQTAIIQCLGQGYCLERDALKYTTSWKNADITAAELIIKSPVKMLNAFCRSRLEEIKRYNEIYNSNLPEEASQKVKLMTILPHTLWQKSLRPQTPSALNQQYDKIFLTMRNQLLFNALDRRLAEEWFTKLGIVYGAAHAPEIDTFIRQQGFKKEDELWLNVLQA